MYNKRNLLTDYRHFKDFGIVDKLDTILVVSFLCRVEPDVINVNESWRYHSAIIRSVIFHGKEGIGVARDL